MSKVKIITLMMLFFSIISLVNASVYDDSIAYWNFDQSSGQVAIDSAGGHDGSLDQPVWDQGYIGNSLNFDGVDDSVDISTNLDVSGNAMTISAWIRADDFGVSDARIISKATDWYTQDHYWMLSTYGYSDPNSKNLRFRLKANGYTATLFGTAPVLPNEWTHVVGWYDGSEMRIYQDGVEVGSTFKTGNIDTNPSVGVRIGDNPGVERARVFDGNIDEVAIWDRALSELEIQELFTGVSGNDTTPPIRSNGLPSDPDLEPTNITVSLTTDEAATCRFDTQPGTNYDSMPFYFQTFPTTSHSLYVGSVSAGATTAYYVKCRDTEGNTNTDDYLITFSTVPAPDTNPPVRSNGLPSGPSIEPTNITVSLITNEAATCRFDIQSGTNYDSMPFYFQTFPTTSHSLYVGSVSAGSTTSYYVKCRDTEGNTNTDDYLITFTTVSPQDSTPPVRINGAPSGTLFWNTSQVTLSVDTNEAATCRYSQFSGVPYVSMPFTLTIDDGQGLSHSTNLAVSSGTSYSYYIKCQDNSGNSNPDEYVVNFAVDSEPELAPVVLSHFPSGVQPPNTTSLFLWLNTDKNAVCKYDTIPGISYDSMSFSFSSTGTQYHSTQVSVFAGNSYTYYVKCTDLSNNSMTDDYVITFSVDSPGDITPPVISNGQPTGILPSNTTIVQVSVNTDEFATCRYATAPGIDYNSMPNVFLTTLGTSHPFIINPLSEGTSYNYYIRCVDQVGNSNTDDYHISFSVLNRAPEIVSITGSDNEIVVKYSEAVDLTSAVDLSNYDINNGITILSAELTSHDKVTLRIQNPVDYELTVNGVSDLSNEEMDNVKEDFSMAICSAGASNPGGGSGSEGSYNPDAPFVISLDPNGDSFAYPVDWVHLTVVTNEDTFCKYDTEPGKDYVDMDYTFDQFGEYHFANVTDLGVLPLDTDIKYYFDCIDVDNNVIQNDSFTVFRVRSP